MKLSARNQLKGIVKAINEGPISSEVVIDINGVEIAKIDSCAEFEQSISKTCKLVNGDWAHHKNGTAARWLA